MYLKCIIFLYDGQSNFKERLEIYNLKNNNMGKPENYTCTKFLSLLYKSHRILYNIDNKSRRQFQQKQKWG